MPDFPQAEYQARLAKAQQAMALAGFDALFLNTEAEIRYFTGFRTLFWQSPTRPWFLILPQSGAPIAVIPTIGAALMRQTWVNDIRTFASPNPDDEGISLLQDALGPFQHIGMPMGQESALRFPPADFDRLRAAIKGRISDATPLIKALRMIKSDAEIDVISKICAIASGAFDQAGTLFHAGQPLSDAFRAFKIALLKAGADDVPYLVGGAGQGGYGDVISPPDNTALARGDVLMLDTGATLQGYFCDFDRNFAIGAAAPQVRDTYRALWSATEAGIAAARSGVRMSELFAAMAQELPQAGGDVGRFGHGLGMQLTEWPSIAANDHSLLAPGMVMTLEPSAEMSAGRMMVHEENILITTGAPLLLSERAAPEIPVI